MTSPSKAEQLRAHAVQREWRASDSHDPQVKAQFIDLASQWRHLAAQVESIARAQRDWYSPKKESTRGMQFPP
jgi:hypothetical protein